MPSSTKVTDLPGDFAEIGVFQGKTFRRLIPAAQAQGKKAHAFDSCIGMNDPGEHDGGEYPRGRCDVGGVQVFREWMLAEGFPEDRFVLWDGYVPDCLHKCPDEQTFSLIYIDLDHHDPTELAINWSWPRLVAGGVLGFDDYFPQRPLYASPPIDRFLVDHAGEYQQLDFENNQLFLQKL